MEEGPSSGTRSGGRKSYVKLFGVNIVESTEESSERSPSDEFSCSKQPQSSAQINRGRAWTEEEHMAFLHGLRKLGKGNWSGIAKTFVKTRSATQVASHAQKHFQRKNKGSKRRISVFDMSPEEIDSSSEGSNAPSSVLQNDEISPQALASSDVGTASCISNPLKVTDNSNPMVNFTGEASQPRLTGKRKARE